MCNYTLRFYTFMCFMYMLFFYKANKEYKEMRTIVMTYFL